MEELLIGSILIWALGRIAKKKADAPAPGTIAPPPQQMPSPGSANYPSTLVDLVDLHTILTILVVIQVVAAEVNYNFFVILFSLSLTALIKKSNYGLS
jgi:hypothetical protein